MAGFARICEAAGPPGAESGGSRHIRYILDTAGRTDSASRPRPTPPPSRQEIRRSRIGTGLGELILGLLFVPVGLAINYGNSLPECEPYEPSTSGFDWGQEPCSEDGPSRTGQAVGIGLYVAGGVMIADGIRRMATASHNLPEPATPAAADSLGPGGGRP
jgi:hypothetical protein